MVFIKNKMLKPTIISISMATAMAGAAIAPALAVIAKAYPDANPTIIKMMLTAPSIAIIPFTFVSSYLTTKLSKRTIAMIGLGTFLIGGVGPSFMTTIELILFFRLILGAGVGILMPLSQSLIYDYFTGTERTKMMGYNSAIGNFWGMAAMLLGGWLAAFGWHFPFYSYMTGVIIFALIFFFLPKGKIREVRQEQQKSKIPFAIYGYAIAMGAVMLVYYSVSTNIALYLEQNNLGGSVLAGTIISLTTFGGMFSSLFIVQIKKLLKKFLILFMLTAMCMAFLFLSITKSIPLVMISVFIVGCGQGLLFPVITMKALDCVQLQQTSKSIAILTSIIFIGQFLSPILLDTISKITGQTAIRFQFAVLSVSILISVIIIIINFMKKNNNSIS